MMRSYDRVAWCTELSPSDYEYFEDLKADGINTAVVCIAASDTREPIGMEQTYNARAAGMNVHAFFMTDLIKPVQDAYHFLKQLEALNYKENVRLAVMPMHEEDLIEEPEHQIKLIFDEIHEYRPDSEIDVVLTKEQLLKAEIIFDLLPEEINLTVTNVGGLNSGIKEAGTWIYTGKYRNHFQLLAYDFYQYYTKAHQSHGFQLDLNTHYEARMGDSWWIIAKQHGMQVLDLLELNHADIADRIIPGQLIKIA